MGSTPNLKGAFSLFNQSSARILLIHKVSVSNSELTEIIIFPCRCSPLFGLAIVNYELSKKNISNLPAVR